MKSRILPPNEWHRLDGNEQLGNVWPFLRPDDTRIVVVEDEGEIVATWAVVRVVHVEGVWVKPEYRRRSLRLVRQLFQSMYEAARQFGVRNVWTSASTPEVEHLLEKGKRAKLAPKSYVMSIGD
jgi:GNAT superfamily N-acetyltransferase